MPAEDRQKENIGFSISVSEDNMEAFLYSKNGQPSQASIDVIKNILDETGIRFGVVDESEITKYLLENSDPKQPLKIAQGRVLQKQAGPTIRYYFHMDPLKPPEIEKPGNVGDDANKIPWRVKKGNLIAEIIPGAAEIRGMDVYGNPIIGPAAEKV